MARSQPVRRFLTALAASLWATAAVSQLGRFDGTPDAALAARRIATEEDLRKIAVIERRVMVPMRDGTLLATDIYRPRDTTHRYPAIFTGTPYEVSSFWDAKLGAPKDMTKVIDAVRRGYVWIVQNYRGTYFSEGRRTTLYPPVTDWQDSFSWIAAQPWSNGKLAPIGCSSHGEWIPATGAAGHPAMAAMVPQGYGAGLGSFGPYREQGNWYRGGAVQSELLLFMYENQFVDRPVFPRISRERLTAASRFFDLMADYPGVDWPEAIRHLPFGDIMAQVQAPRGITTDRIEGAPGKPLLDRTPADGDWGDQNFYDESMGMRTPGLWFVSWYDLAAAPNIAAFNHAAAAASPAIARQQHMVIFPERHCHFEDGTEHTIVGERDVGDARFDVPALTWAWMGQYLQGVPSARIATLPRVTYYTMAKGWQQADRWPPAGARPVTLYLKSHGNANGLDGDGTLDLSPASHGAQDVWRYDPAKPVPSMGGGVCCMARGLNAGAFDQRAIERRRDVLVYSTAPLRRGVEVTGPATATLYLSSDRTDTDLTVKLVDVYPDGRAYNIDNSIQRVRYRAGYDHPAPMVPGTVYPVTVGPMVTSNWFAPGHRIRLEVSSSNFPQFERNLNRGDENAKARDPLVATNVIHHDRRYRSALTLSVVGAAP